MHAVSLTLHCKLWRETGHNFNRLRELLIPDRTQLRMSDMAALTRAAILKEVCLHDTDRGMQLMEGIQVGCNPFVLNLCKTKGPSPPSIVISRKRECVICAAANTTGASAGR